MGSANLEQGDPQVPSAFVYSVGPRSVVESSIIPGILSTTGPIAAADYTGNGHIDLFVGGRFKPGQFPRDAQSRFFKNVNGTFQLDEQNSRLLDEGCLATAAVFSDFNQNGSQDLLISCEWDTLRLFRNEGGRFREVTAEVGLDAYRGWWNGVATGDFNNDGFPDIIATNLGRNSPYQVTHGRPLRMYYGDFNLNGRLDILESYYDQHSGAYRPRRKLHEIGSLSRILLQLRTNAAYAAATVEQLFDLFDMGANVSVKEINTLEHMLFINTGGGFSAHALPSDAQFSAAFYAGVADFDNDGNEDLFLAQNSFAFPSSTPRLDAGRGLVLMGDGTGNLTPVSGSESGIKVYGEQRGAALADFNGDGRVDLVVTQNNEETRLLLNTTNSAGIRMRLVGPESNADGIGSSIGIVYTDGTRGPRREIQAGSGYWSQNGRTQTMGLQPDPDHIEVTWFDGSVDTVGVVPGRLTYEIIY